MSFGGSSSSGSIHTSTDVALNNPADGQVLGYSGSLAKWQNQPALATGTTAGTAAAGNDGRFTTITANPQAASVTLALTDAGCVIDLASSSATTVTVPTNASVAFPLGTVVEVCQLGTGQITIAAASGVTLHTSASTTTRAQYATVLLRQQAVNVWILGGDLT